jgi:hypothetical protein
VGRVSVFVLLALVLGGCFGDDQPQQKAPPDKQASRSSDPANEPYGRLSPSEYRAIVREYRELEPIQQGRDDPSELERGRAICAALREPATELVVRVRGDCHNALSFFSALTNLEQASSECDGSQRDRLACARDRYLTMARAIRSTANGAKAINEELRRRGITGLCARSIGITESQLLSYRRAERAARDGAAAIAVGDSAGFDQAAGALGDALTSGASDDPLAGIERGCRKSSPKPLPRVPEGGGISA